MPEGYRASLILGPGSEVELSQTCFMMHFGVPYLVGEGPELVATAGYNGQLYYFPIQRAYGIPIILLSHPLRAKFWWLFKEFSVPEAGVMYSLSWIHSQPDAVVMTMAEFIVPVMSRMLQVRLESDQSLQDADLNGWLAELVIMLTENSKVQVTSVVPNYVREIVSDGAESAPCLQSYTIWLTDGSVVTLDGNGYAIDQPSVYLVPVRDCLQPRVTEFQTVEVHHTFPESTRMH